MIFTAAERVVPNNGVRNAASIEVFALAGVTFAGIPKADETITITINDKEYKYKVTDMDNLETIVDALVSLINADGGDPNVLATPNRQLFLLVLTARSGGAAGNEITLSATTAGATANTGAQIQATASGANLAGGGDAAQLAPGTLVAIFGDGFSTTTTSVPANTTTLPRELAGVQVYFDGIKSPLLMVSPNEIRAQIPWEVNDADSSNFYVRQVLSNGTVRVTTAVSIPVVKQNPGIFAIEGVIDPRPAIAVHSSNFATGTISVDGSTFGGDVATINIEDRIYKYVVQEGDTLYSVRDALVLLINSGDPRVSATGSALFTRIRLSSRAEGPIGNGLQFTGSNEGASGILITPLTVGLCCANSKGAPVTDDNPALPGETILVYGTGLGLVKPDTARAGQITGQAYTGSEFNDPREFVSSLAGARTANVLSAGLLPGTVGIYEVALELNSGLPTNAKTNLTIAQSFFVSNIVTIPVVNPEQ
jgi:uncharacterized protein (TIGR03437 family)